MSHINSNIQAFWQYNDILNRTDKTKVLNFVDMTSVKGKAIPN